jgi:hypothetical protein
VTICCQQQHRCNCSSSQPLKGRHLTASFIKPCACTCSLRGSSVGCWSTHWSATSTDKLLLLLLLLLLCLQGARLHLCVTSHRRKATRPSAHRHWVPVWTTAAWCLCCLLLHHTKCDRWGGGWWWVDVLVSSWVGLVAAAAAAAACIYGIAKSGLVCLLSSAHHLRCPAVCSWKPLAGPAQRGCCVEPGSGRVLFRDYADGVLASLV